jgi:signal transduction histidine kinase
MNYQDRTKEQLLNDLQQFELEIGALKELADNYKRITDELNQERELYADLANALPAGIYRLRVFCDESQINEKWSSLNDAPYIFEFANDRFFEILNINKHDFEKNPGIINELIFEADKAEFVRMNIEANLHKTPFIWEGRILIKDKIIWIHFESIPRVLENGDILWTGTLNNINKRKNEEQEIALKTQELHKLNAEKDKFFSIIAHDLNSPFNSIMGFSGLLTKQIQNKDYQNIFKYAKIIRQSSEKAMNLLSNLMEWVQSQTGKIVFNPKNIEIEDFINENKLLFEEIASQKLITIKKMFPANTTFFADKEMINTVFRNLISNAIKFTKPNGEIVISAVKKQNEVIFSVSDTGIGIPKKSIEKLFRLDQSFSTDGTNNEKGTGLGLILCKEFIKIHNGEIWIESEEGKGTCFYFTCPCNN